MHCPQEYSFVKIYVGMNDTLNPKDYNTVPYDELSSDDLNTVYTAVYQARGMVCYNMYKLYN